MFSLRSVWPWGPGLWTRTHPRIIKNPEDSEDEVQLPQSLRQSLDIEYIPDDSLLSCHSFLLKKEYKMCKMLLVSGFVIASRLNGNLLYFSVWRRYRFFKTFSTFFFICCLIVGNNAHTWACVFITLGTTRRVSFLKREARMVRRRNVLKNMFQSLSHPHNWEGTKCSLHRSSSHGFILIYSTSVLQSFTTEKKKRGGLKSF